MHREFIRRKRGVVRMGPGMNGNSVLNELLCKAYATRLWPFNTRRAHSKGKVLWFCTRYTQTRRCIKELRFLVNHSRLISPIYDWRRMRTNVRTGDYRWTVTIHYCHYNNGNDRNIVLMPISCILISDYSFGSVQNWWAD